MFYKLEDINKRPKPYQFYTALELWTDEHTSKKMLDYHLNAEIDASSRNINFINKSADWIFKKFNLSEKSKIIDFGCGPGLYTTLFAKKGINVTGVDFSKRSLEYAMQTAKNEGLHINYVHKNYLEFETADKYNLITMIMCDYCALSPKQRKTMLGKFKSLMKDDSSILLDVYSLNSFDNKEEVAVYELNQLSNFWSPDDYYCFLNTFKYNEEKVALDKYTIVEKNRMRIVYNWMQYFSIDTLRKEFEDNDLNITELYSDVSGSPYNKKAMEIAIIAKKFSSRK